MPSYQPALLIEIVNEELVGDEIEGEAVMRLSHHERGGLEASGTFKATTERLGGIPGLISRLFQYEGPAVEGSKTYEVRATVYIATVQGNLYGIESSTEPVIVERL